MPEIEDFLATLESDDAKIKELRKKAEAGVFDEREFIEQSVNNAIE